MLRERIQAIEAATISETASFADVVLGNGELTEALCPDFGGRGGIITISDLQKPPVPWTLWNGHALGDADNSDYRFECPGDSWMHISPRAVYKRPRNSWRNGRTIQSLELIDLLQISDKGQIIARNEEIRCLTRMQSRRQTEQTSRCWKACEIIWPIPRNISFDWETIVWLCKAMERVISGTDEVQRVLEEK